MDLLPFPVLFLQRHHAAKKVDPTKSRLTALPSEHHFGPRLRGDMLANKRL